MSQRLYILEPTVTGFAAYVPDLPGCAATVDTWGDVDGAIREALEFPVDGLREDGLDVPESSVTAADAEVEMA